MRISKFFENHLPGESWHQGLLRPALIEDAELFEALEDLRCFRQVFRHNYGTRLKREKLALVQKAFEYALEQFPLAHDRFVAQITAGAQALP